MIPEGIESQQAARISSRPVRIGGKSMVAPQWLVDWIVNNGKPQASLTDFAYACRSPLNEKAQYATKSTSR